MLGLAFTLLLDDDNDKDVDDVPVSSSLLSRGLSEASALLNEVRLPPLPFDVVDVGTFVLVVVVFGVVTVALVGANGAAIVAVVVVVGVYEGLGSVNDVEPLFLLLGETLPLRFPLLLLREIEEEAEEEVSLVEKDKVGPLLTFEDEDDLRFDPPPLLLLDSPLRPSFSFLELFEDDFLFLDFSPPPFPSRRA